jgi:uncharacterized protein YndB with AHSA1/START domain
MPYGFTVTDVMPTTPEDVYDAWMSSDRHTAMTGDAAKIDARVGGAFEAGDGYISGTTLKLEPGHRLVQSWRTTDFAARDPDSRIDVLFEPVPDGTKVTLRHTSIPDGQAGYEQGWRDFYFAPMRQYFAKAE